MLGLTGAFDNISVVVRSTLMQVLTPDRLRGRVSAVNSIFIGCSNELGSFESGMTAAAFGPIPSVVGGGIGSLFVVLLTRFVWPELGPPRLARRPQARGRARGPHFGLAGASGASATLTTLPPFMTNPTFPAA